MYGDTGEGKTGEGKGDAKAGGKRCALQGEDKKIWSNRTMVSDYLSDEYSNSGLLVYGCISGEKENTAAEKVICRGIHFVPDSGNAFGIYNFVCFVSHWIRFCRLTAAVCRGSIRKK